MDSEALANFDECFDDAVMGEWDEKGRRQRIRCGGDSSYILDTSGLEKWRAKTKGMARGAERGLFLKQAFDEALLFHVSTPHGRQNWNGHAG